MQGWTIDRPTYFEAVEQVERKYLRRFRIYFRLAIWFRDLGWPGAAKFFGERVEGIGERVRAELAAMGFDDPRQNRRDAVRDVIETAMAAARRR